ncbi:NFX1-type zinc finger-containing protein 1 [Cladobotryum mycophilum]|uniref:NFX1-type zinc finger-containing protein 1 n=1 Tax=Cladobotryum mycophilum TaxID=491253 RepID=A0ABR0S891_9HYPO
MVSHNIPSARAGKLVKLFYQCISGEKLIQTSHDANLFFQAVDNFCQEKSASTCVESILSKPKGIETLRSVVRSNLSSEFIASTSMRFIQHLADPHVKTLNNGQFLTQILVAILSPPMFWNALQEAYVKDALQGENLVTFAWLCLEIVSSQSSDLQGLFSDVKSLNENKPLLNSSHELVRELAYKIKKVIQLRGTSATASVNIDYSPGGRHDNDFVDFREISIYPTTDEIVSSQQPFLQRLDDVFEVPSETRARNHLDWLFRLLREDMLGEMREDLQIAWGQKKAKRRPLSLSQLVLLKCDVGHPKSTKPLTLWLRCYRGIAFPKSKTTPESRKKYLEEYKSFVKHNSFGALCLGQTVVAFGTIIRDVDMLAAEPPAVGIQFTDMVGLRRAMVHLLDQNKRPHLEFFLVDTATFAYEPILQRLKEITEVPLDNELLSLQGQVSDYQAPIKIQNLLEILRDAVVDDMEVDLSLVVPMKTPIRVRGAQLQSLINGLESPLGQIQGPPGTGKSFIGALLVLIILRLTNQRILVLSYTNHALDQFLEDLMNIGINGDDMVRLGSKATEKTESLRIENRQKEIKFRQTANVWAMVDQHKLEFTEVEQKLEQVMDQLRSKITAHDILDMLEFSEFGSQIWDAFQVMQLPDNFQVAGKKNRAMKPEDLYNTWLEGRSLRNVAVLVNSLGAEARAVWMIPPPNRRELHATWCNFVRSDQIDEFVVLTEKSNELHRQIDSLFKEGKRQILRSKRVIGCTTTAAAMYQSIIKASEPDVVMVEEAGEILEAHVITALSPSVKQLILIGDHKQLRPKVNNYKLTLEGGDGFDLNVSLFERLIRQGHHFTTLQEQHRSHPDISYFARLLAYDELKDHAKTLSRQKMRGLRERVVFVHHEQPEEQLSDVVDKRDPASKSSKKNMYEAEMVLKMVKYLGQQGYKSENMVVLTPYLGQLSLLRQKLSEINDPHLNDLDSHELVRAGLMSQAAAKANKARLRLSTVDNYQGEESDIVIVSMTRSNNRGDIGFLIARERLVVLMSRAREGIILFGNMNTFLSNKKGGAMWKTYFDAMKTKGFLFDGVPARCEQHPDRLALLKMPRDFEQHCPDGGCAELCGAVLSCQKHTCERRCHRLADHSKVQCTKMMKKKCERGHGMKFLCGNDKQGCRDCAREDEENRRRIQRDLDLEKTRLEREDKYRKQLQEMEDEIDHHRRVMKYNKEEEDQKKTIAEKKAQLQSLKETQARMEAAKKAAEAVNGPSKSKDTDTKPKVKRTPSGKAGQEWALMKKNEGACNDALDKLMELIGLETVKQEFLSIKSMVDMKIRQGASLDKERLSCSLLGNPGTGKTTVARLWGSFLTGIGAIAGDDFKETTGSKLASIGVPGCEKLIEEIKDNGGGVFFIDEAYQLSSGNSPGGKAVLDYLLAEVENLRGKVVFVLAGYAKQMESFFAHNPGFPSRFPIEMKFEDYTDEELREILEMQVVRKYDGKMKIEDGVDGLYFRIASRRVGRSRGKEGFGNARAVENSLANMEKRQANRVRAERRAGKTPDDFSYTKEDIIGPEPSAALENCKAWQKLNQMIGLNAVKEQAKILLDSLKTNYERELAEEPLIEFSLNRVFLGSPGTGKTTVAKLYGRILVDLGLLSNGEVLVRTPADFIGSVLGQSEANTKGILAASVGKVLVIDEAYGLYGGSSSVADPYKTGVIDTIVAEVQNVPGDDRCVIMIGYQEQMEQMFQNVNPGLSRRFSVDNPFVFEDFDDDGLRQVLDLKLKTSGFATTGEGKRAALDVLIRERNRPNFGNGGAVENLLSKAKLSYQKRMSSGKVKRNQLEPVDFDEDFDRSTRKDTNVRQLFKDDIGREDIIAMLEKIQSRVRQLKSLDMDVKEEIPFNFLFRGPPGTGKSTTARKMGKVYYDMGFLTNAAVRDCSASDLVGQYVGQTAQKTRAVLESALGKVLLIDEAYRLAEGHFAKEALDEIVDSLTKPKYQGKLIVILAGYDNDINRLLSVNPGLSSRFPETVDFAPLSAEACFQLLINLLQKRKVELAANKKDLDMSCLESPSKGFKKYAMDILTDLAAVEGWASARDVETLAKNVFRMVDLSVESFKLEENQVLLELDKMLHERQGRLNTGSAPGFKGAAPEMNFHQSAPPKPSFSTSLPFHTKTEEHHETAEEEPSAESAPEIEKVDNSRFGPAIRDAGVSDEIWEQLQKDRTEAERRDNEYRALLKAQKTASDADREKIVRQIVEEERRRKLEMEKQARLAAMGACPAGFNWIKQAEGYRCAGGSHYMSDVEIEKV